MLIPFDNLIVKLEEPQDFCLDGEKRRLTGELRFSAQTLNQEIDVVNTPFTRRKSSRVRRLAATGTIDR